jgi:hypothetical protein
VLDETRGMSVELLATLFFRGEEREVEWMVKEGCVLGVIRSVREKGERKRNVMSYAWWAVAAFRHPLSDPIRHVRKEWKGKKEWRKEMWMMEEEGEIDSVCGMKEADGWYYAKQVLGLLGICCL